MITVQRNSRSPEIYQLLNNHYHHYTVNDTVPKWSWWTTRCQWLNGSTIDSAFIWAYSMYYISSVSALHTLHNINQTVSVVQNCVAVKRCTMLRTLVTGRLTASSFHLARFNWISSDHLCIFDLHGKIYIYIFLLYSLPFSELSLAGLALDLRDKTLSFSAKTCWLGPVTRKIVPRMTYVSSGTLNPTIWYQAYTAFLSSTAAV